MPTPSEQKALTFVAIVILLGGAVRVVRAGSSSAPTQLEQQALARQATAADSAAAKAKNAKKAKTAKVSKRVKAAGDTLPQVVGGVASVPPTFARPDKPYSHAPFSAQAASAPFPPPGPRIDTNIGGFAPSGAPVSTAPSRPGGKPLVTAPIDLDIATVDQIEALPRIGQLLAKRIVANRDSLGPFRSLEGLKRVRGLGPATLQQLSPIVTFSGRSGVRSTNP
jgi:competence protein ComEA